MTNTKLQCIWRDGCNQPDACKAAECCQGLRSNREKAEQVPSKERGCYVMDGVMYTSHADGSETSRKATDEEVLLADALLRATDELRGCSRELAIERRAAQRAAHEPRAPRSDDNLHLDEESGAVSVDHAAIVAAIRRERTEKADATPYMLNGTRFKLAFNNRGETSSFAGYHPQLHGRWVALVDATDDRHMRAAQPPPSEHPDKARIDWLNDQPVHFIELDDFSIIDAKGLDVRTAIDAKRSAPTKESCL